MSSPARVAALLAAALAAAGCGPGEEPAPATPAPAPAPPPSPAPARAAPADGGAAGYEAALRRARALAARARGTRDPAAAKAATDALDAAAALRPGDGEPLLEAGLLALDLGDGAAAARSLAALAESAPGSGPYRFLRGSLLLARGEHRDAAGEFRAAAKAGFRARLAEERVFEATLGLGLALVDQLRFEEAVGALAEAAAMRPDHPLVSRGSYAMALAYRRLREPAEAERVLRECIERFPTFAPAYAELGDLAAALGRPEEAAALLDRAVAVDPSYAPGWLLKAASHGARGEFPEAEAAFAEFGRRSPPTAESEFRLGEFLHRKGEPERALARLQRALEIDPSRIRAHYFVALCLRDLGWDEESAEAMERWRSAEEALRSGHHGKPAGSRATRPPAERSGGGEPAGEDEPRR